MKEDVSVEEPRAPLAMTVPLTRSFPSTLPAAPTNHSRGLPGRGGGLGCSISPVFLFRVEKSVELQEKGESLGGFLVFSSNFHDFPTF